MIIAQALYNPPELPNTYREHAHSKASVKADNKNIVKGVSEFHKRSRAVFHMNFNTYSMHG